MLARCVYSHCNICDIQMKHLKHTFETPETLSCRRPHPSWWGSVVANKLGLGGRQEQRPNVQLRHRCRPPFLPRCLWLATGDNVLTSGDLLHPSGVGVVAAR
jgi:hypothetical protein